jgi:hypothetical protein
LASFTLIGEADDKHGTRASAQRITEMNEISKWLSGSNNDRAMRMDQAARGNIKGDIFKSLEVLNVSLTVH